MKHTRINWFEVLFWGVVVTFTAAALVGCEQRPNHPATPDSSLVPRMQVPDGTPPGSTIEWEAVIDGAVGVQDIFDFLADYFASPRMSEGDLFDFLAAWME